MREEYTTGSGVLESCSPRYGRRTELTLQTRDFLARIAIYSSGCTIWLFGPVSESAHRKLEAIPLLNDSALITEYDLVFDGLNASYAIRHTLQLASRASSSIHRLRLSLSKSRRTTDLILAQ